MDTSLEVMYDKIQREAGAGSKIYEMWGLKTNTQ